MAPPRRAALFDLDRTLVRVDTATLYVRYQRRIGEAGWWDSVKVAWWALLYTFDLINAEAVAAKVIAPLAGMPEMVMAARCDDWFRRYVEPHVCDEARLAVRRHQEAGDLIAIVTGASPYAARPMARRLGIEYVLATTLQVERGCFTGRPELPLCYGQGKVDKAVRLLGQHGLCLADATFYSDSITDLPLLSAVGTPVLVNPDPSLARLGRSRGWRAERW